MATLSARGQNGTSGTVDSKSPISNVHGVLKILNSRLGAEGNVRDPKDVAYFMVLMAEAVKLADRCMFVNVLRATKSHSILRIILEKGGWATLHTWLQQCRSEDGNAFLYELLLLYKHVPVSVELLRQNSCAKDIKQLIKSSDDKISRLAKIIVTNWMEKVKEKGSSDGSTGSKHADKSPSNHRHNRVSSTDGASGSGSSHSSSSSKDKSSERHSSSKTIKDDVDPSRIKTLQDSPDHITSKMNHSALSADRIHTTNDDSSSSNSMSVDMDGAQPTSVHHRPKTVKMIGSKMRSTGLELDTPLPPSKKSAASPSDKDKLTHTSASNKSHSAKKVLDKKSTTQSSSTSSNGSSNATSSHSSVESKPKVKVIPAKPRQTEIYESSGFMDALNSTDPVIGRRKRKLAAPAAVVPGSSKPHSTGTVPVSPDEKKPAPFSTMDMDDSWKKGDLSNSIDVTSQSPGNDKSTSDEQTMEHSGSGAADTSLVKDDDSAKESAVKVELAGETTSGPKDSPTEPPSKKKKVKGVTWVDDAKLCSFFYFQLDENERVNVNKIQDFAEIRKHEQEMERHMMQNVRRMAHDVMAEKRVWRKPFLITGLVQVVNYGCNSKEKEVQRERELGVLQILYFTKNSIPDSAVEPEPEYFELIEPKIIPLTDETGLGSEVKYDSYPGAVNPIPNSMTSLPPAIASLLSTTANQVKNAAGGGSPLNQSLLPPQMSPTSAQPPQPIPPSVSLPPLHVFLGMAFPAQQHIFRAMPPHVQQQMMNSLPPPLQQQLAPLMSTPMMNGAQPGPGTMAPDARPMGPGSMPFRPAGPQGPNFQRMPGGPGRMPRPLMETPMNGGGRPLLPDGPMFPQRPPMVRGPPMGANPPGRVCPHFLAGSCRFGNTCRNIHPPRDGLHPGAPGIVAHDGPH